MNDDLITRLRELAAMARFLPISDDLDAAADALEAAQREAERLSFAYADLSDAWDQAVADRDAAEADAASEAALADRLADSLSLWEGEPDADPALAAHRERRTTPTKDGER